MLKEIFFWLFNFYFNSITSVGFKKKYAGFMGRIH